MEVILREHVDNLGRRGEIVKVADGYARNYLLPRKLALLATDGNKKQIERERAKFDAKEAEEKKVAEAMAARLANVEVVIARKVGETEALYGSVTSGGHRRGAGGQGLRHRSAQAAAAEPIKKLGEYDVPVKLHRDVTAHDQSEGRCRRRRGCARNVRTRSRDVDDQIGGHGASICFSGPFHFSVRLFCSRSSPLRSMPETAVAERTLPHNLEAERSVLGAILLHNDAFNLAAEVIDSADFFRDAHRRIFDKMVKLAERGDAIDLVTLKEELGRGRASSTRSAARPTSPRSSTACRARPTSSTTRGSSRRRRPSGT